MADDDSCSLTDSVSTISVDSATYSNLSVTSANLSVTSANLSAVPGNTLQNARGRKRHESLPHDSVKGVVVLYLHCNLIVQKCSQDFCFFSFPLDHKYLNSRFTF